MTLRDHNMTARRWLKGLVLLVACFPVSQTQAQGYPAAEAAKRMSVADGFEVELVASEPLVRQPVAIDFDDRGRLWVLQYLQYPNPAGLKRVEVDQYTRSKYDRVPDPPPRGPKGADRLTILEDTDGDGRMDRSKDFLTELNLASGFAFGHGGVYVLQAPYLLFYPDRDRDDVPDSDPEVLLTGFGMDDASAVANSLTWGPDGWLYGCQGSTVTAVIRGIKFVQGIWRYHPVSKEFELFAEGGGNMWGLDFDRHGRLLASTNVGKYVMWHMVQGGYYWKKFSKHGPLRNPYTFGYFDHVPHKSFRGGHVTVGGTFYQGDTFPSRFRDKYISGDLLGHGVYFHRVASDGTTFSSEHGGELLQANDSWFASTDLTVGPDGAVYVTDWHDQRTAHPNPDAEWDRTNGRIYRLQARGVDSVPRGDLHEKTSDRLVEMLSLSNEWYVRAARRELAARRDKSVWPRLRWAALESVDDRLVLNSLWTLASTGGFDEPTVAQLLEHRNEHVRAWTIRLLGDRSHARQSVDNQHDNSHSGERGFELTSATFEQLERMAKDDPSSIVRSQLASTAARLSAKRGLAITHALLLRNMDANDPHIPLLLWWSVERHAIEAIDDVERRFVHAEAWRQPLIRDVILNRLMQRFAAEATPRTLAICMRLIDFAPTPKDERRLLSALDAGLAMAPRRAGDKPLTDRIPSELKQRLADEWSKKPFNVTLLQLNGRLGNRAVAEHALRVVTNDDSGKKQRIAMFRVLRQFGDESSIAILLPLIDANRPDWLRRAAMEVLSRYADDRIGKALLAAYADYDGGGRASARRILFARKTWAVGFLKRIDSGAFESHEVTSGELSALSAHGDESITGLVHKHWGRIDRASSQQKIAEIRRVRFDLRGSGDLQRGKTLFTKHCSACHQLFGEGKKLGPNLTTANRKDRDYLLESIIDPSRFIRKEYVASVVVTVNGRVLTGMIVEDTPSQIVLAGNKNERSTIRREDIEQSHNSPVSLMPDNILKPLKGQELRDLFRYLQSGSAD